MARRSIHVSSSGGFRSCLRRHSYCKHTPKSQSTNNKKVLLRERKRHTARRVASARYAKGGYPVPGPGGVPHHRSGGRGVPHPRSAGTLGTPHLPDLGWGTPPGQTWDGVPPPGQTWDGVPPPARPGMGYPPPPASVDRHTDSCQNITFPRTTYAGGKKL